MMRGRVFMGGCVSWGALLVAVLPAQAQLAPLRIQGVPQRGQGAREGPAGGARKVGMGNKGEPGAQEQREGARVRSVIHAARVHGGVVEQRHLQRGDAREGEGRAPDAPPVLSRVQRDHEGDGPHQVKLHLDGERPKMRERGGIAHGVEVGLLVKDLPPVVHKECRGDDIGPHLGEHDVVEARAQRRRDHDDGDDGGHEALESAVPKALEVDAPGAGVLLEQQVRDEKARQHKEHRDALHAAGGERGDDMIQNDCRHRQRADAIECGDIAAAVSFGGLGDQGCVSFQVCRVCGQGRL